MKLRMPERLAEAGSARCANCGETIMELSEVPELCARCVLETNGDLIICHTCGREWTEPSEAHCAGCHRHFSSDSAFDKHQAIDHRPCSKRPENQGDNKHKVCAAQSVCRDPATLKKRDGSPPLRQIETDRGTTWATPEMPPEVIARMKGKP
jgi:hypothetical protein